MNQFSGRPTDYLKFKIMTKKEVDNYKNKLQEIVDNGYDPEADHSNADEILCEILTKLGCKDIVDVYTNIIKWYA